VIHCPTCSEMPQPSSWCPVCIQLRAEDELRRPGPAVRARGLAWMFLAVALLPFNVVRYTTRILKKENRT